MPADPSFAIQKAIRGLLIGSYELMALVPVEHVLEVNARPERSPCIIMGEGQTVHQRFHATAYVDLHVWVQEPGLSQAKTIAGIITDAIDHDPQDGVLHLDGFICHQLSVNTTRFVRDPHGSYSHAIVSCAGLVKAT